MRLLKVNKTAVLMTKINMFLKLKTIGAKVFF